MKKKTIASLGVVAVIAAMSVGAFLEKSRRETCFLVDDTLAKSRINPVTSLQVNPIEKSNEKSPVRILITGANSYVGTHVEQYLSQWTESYQVDTVDMVGEKWKTSDFSNYDVVFHVAGIAHSDVSTASNEQKQLYYDVNTILAIDTAKKAKLEGVGQFIFMSSMIIYGGAGKIDETTEPSPANFYGDSKWQADKGVRELSDKSFKVVIVRPPMIYGRGCKGNYPQLSKIAQSVPVFPETVNRRSVLHIDNLCNFIKLMIDNQESGIFFPQNSELVSTSQIVQAIAKVHGKRVLISSLLTPATFLGAVMPGAIGKLSKKAFGSSFYSPSLSVYQEPYVLHDFEESVRLTELNKIKDEPHDAARSNLPLSGMRILAISQYYWPEPFNVSEICEELVARGAEVTMLTGLPNYPEGDIYEGYKSDPPLEEMHNGVYVLRVHDFPRKHGPFFRAANYYSFSILASAKAGSLTGQFDAVLAFIISPVMSAEPAIAAADAFSLPLLGYVIDLWPECLLAGGIKKGSFAYNYYQKVSRRIYGAIDRLAVTSPLFEDYLDTLLGRRTHATILPQYAEDSFSQVASNADRHAENFSDDKINLTFAGNIGTAQAVDTIIRTATDLKDDNRFCFHIVGSGSELDTCKSMASSNGLSNVIFHGRLPLETMPEIYSSSDAMIATFANMPVLGYTLPRKIQSYMASGRPILVSAVGESSRVIREAKCGFCCTAEDHQSLAKACLEFASLSDNERKELGSNAKNYYKQHYSRDQFFETLEKELQQLKGTKHGR